MAQSKRKLFLFKKIFKNVHEFSYQPSAEILDYATTKAAIVGFTKGLAEALLEKGIRVNCAAPGPVWTPLIVSTFPKDEINQFGAEVIFL